MLTVPSLTVHLCDPRSPHSQTVRGSPKASSTTLKRKRYAPGMVIICRMIGKACDVASGCVIAMLFHEMGNPQPSPAKTLVDVVLSSFFLSSYGVQFQVSGEGSETRREWGTCIGCLKV